MAKRLENLTPGKSGLGGISWVYFPCRYLNYYYAGLKVVQKLWTGDNLYCTFIRDLEEHST